MKITLTKQEITEKFNLPIDAEIVIDGYYSNTGTLELSEKVSPIRDLTNKFVEVAKSKDFPLFYTNEEQVDPDIFNWLPNAPSATGEVPPSNITMLPKDGMTEGDMLKTALKLPLAQAIMKMTTELTTGYFDEKKKILIIYLTDSKDGVPLKLIGSRYGDGELYLSVSKVFGDDRWVVDGRVVGFLSNPS